MARFNVPFDQIPHGKWSGYTDYGCRCPECTRANREGVAAARARRALGPIPPTVQHGKRDTYINWGCRCKYCSAAQRWYRRQQRALKRK